MAEEKHWPSMKTVLIAVVVMNMVSIGLAEIQRRALVRDIVSTGISEVQRQVLIDGIRDVLVDVRENQRRMAAKEEEETFRLYNISNGISARVERVEDFYRILNDIDARVIKIEDYTQFVPATSNRLQEMQNQFKAINAKPDITR
jgi:hypothetical protein